jgi:hypothetical protein
MGKIINEDMFDEILASGPKPFFFQKEEDGEVTIIFTSPIQITEPGEEDISGRMWNPPTTDANGNPLLDFRGNQREPWAKVEAEAIIKGLPSVYAMGGRESGLFKAWIGAMKTNEIKNTDLPGTKWTAMRTGKWNYTITYIGRDESVSLNTNNPTLNEIVIGKVKDVLSDLKTKNPLVTKGVQKSQLIKTVALLSGENQAYIESIWFLLVKDKTVIEKDGKVLVS